MLQILVILSIALIICGTPPASAREDTLGKDCMVVDPTGTPLNVRAQPRGEIVGTLRNGNSVAIDRWAMPVQDERGKDWVEIEVVSGGRLVPVGYVFQSYIDCNYSRTRSEYPIIFTEADSMKTLGFYFPDFNVFPFSNRTALDNKCFYYGDGGPSLSLSEEFVSGYRSRGFDFDKLCLVMRSGIVRFDPETGARLPTFLRR